MDPDQLLVSIEARTADAANDDARIHQFARLHATGIGRNHIQPAGASSQRDEHISFSGGGLVGVSREVVGFDDPTDNSLHLYPEGVVGAGEQVVEAMALRRRHRAVTEDGYAGMRDERRVASRSADTFDLYSISRPKREARVG